MRSHHLRCFLHLLPSSWPGKGWLLHRTEPQRNRVSAPLTSRWPLVCRKAPAGRAGPHLNTCPNTTTVVLETGRYFAPPPHPSPHHQDKEPAKICVFPKAGLQQMRPSQNILTHGVFVRLRKPTPPTSAAAGISPHLRQRALAFQTN